MHNLNRGAEFRYGFPVTDDTGRDVSRDADELEVGVSVVDSVDTGTRRESSRDCVSFRWDGHQFGVGKVLERRNDDASMATFDFGIRFRSGSRINGTY